MKKVIDGLMFNTETAEMIGEYSNGQMFTDAYYVSETLYKTKKDNYFLFCYGGALSEYNDNCEGGWCAGKRIKRLTHEEAFLWSEIHLDGDQVLEKFKEFVKEG